MTTHQLNSLMALGIEIIPDAALAHYTTFRLGGPCPFLLECKTPSQLEQAVQALNEQKMKFILIGGGSNLVVSDQGVDRAVIRYVSDHPLIQHEDGVLYVAASTILDDLALYCAQHGLEGLNCTTGIPGTVGGAVVGNAGAFGKQIGDCLQTAVLLSPDGKTRETVNKDLKFTYRNSRLKETDDIVVAARFKLGTADPQHLMQERAEILSLRHEKHPDVGLLPCAGSFFRNIEPTSKAEKRQAAGFFLEEAGAKKLKVGGAAIFEKHANIIIKADEQCKAQDVFELSRQMHELVKRTQKLDLVREVRFVGHFSGGDGKGMFW